jgi:DNA-binding GntR family transcriptional regulator
MLMLEMDEATGPAARHKAEHAYNLLVEKIIGLEFKPGEGLPEKRLMHELALGRTPVREALQRLAVEGLVCREPHQGIYVCEVTRESVQQLYEYRLVADGMVARLAAERIGKDVIPSLHDLLERSREQIAQGQFTQYVKHARAIYVSIAKCATNLYFEEAAPRIFNLDARLILIASRAREDWQALAADTIGAFEGLLGSFEHKLPDEAEHVAKLHVVRHYREILERVG